MNISKLISGTMLLAGLSLIGACGDDEEPKNDAGVSSDTGTLTDTGVDAGVGDTGSGDTGSGDTGGSGGFEQPANTVAVNFRVDDTANKAYDDNAGLAWKGSVIFDAETRIAVLDTSWTGPYPLMYDDGPWNEGGHEPAGSTAGDNIWGVTVFVEPKDDAAIDFEYGLVRGSEGGVNQDSDEWIWIGPNGTYSVPALAVDAVDVPTFTVPAWGTIDWRLTLDTNNLPAEFVLDPAFDPSAGHTVEIKSGKWGWSLIPTSDAGDKGDATADDGIYTFELGSYVGPGTDLPYDGLFESGEAAEFVFAFRLGETVSEYKVAGTPPTDAVTSEFSTDGGSTWTAATLDYAENGNTRATAP